MNGLRTVVMAAILSAAWGEAAHAGGAPGVSHAGDETAAPAPASAAPPCLLITQPEVRPYVDVAWALSSTFRVQCSRLAEARAVVRLHADGAVHRAVSRIGRSPRGVVVAHVRVRLGEDTIEFIAHELEHVLERVEGVSYLLELDGSTVTAKGGAFETRRATDAGERVADEVRKAMRLTGCHNASR